VDSDFYRSFARPRAGKARFLEWSVESHAEETVSQFLVRSKDVAKPLRRVFSSWRRRGCGFDAAWTLAFGEFLAAHAEDDSSDRLRAVASLALRLHETGQEGEWQIRLPEAARFHFDRWILPRAGALRVRASPDRVLIDMEDTTGGHRRAEFCRSAGEWTCEGALALPVVTWRGTRWPILFAECISSPALTPLLSDRACSAFAHRDAAQRSRLAGDVVESMKLIERMAPVYAGWVTRVVNRLLLLRPTAHKLNSTTHSLAPGVVGLSNPDDPVLLAEILVHEATHQYLFVLGKLQPLDDGTDTVLYFSPFKNCGRPIASIVLTYHAFGNVLLFYRSLRAALANRAHRGKRLVRRIESLEADLGVLEGHLESSRSLTPAGEGLWQPLYEEIHAAGCR
jgi:HEXXH motif-containing protein